MAYRNDVGALAARHEALVAEVNEKTRDRDEVARLLEEARARERNEQLYQDYASGGPQRRRRRRIRIALALAAFTTAVLGLVFALRVTHHKIDRTAEAMLKMNQFADELCQCRDARCAQDVTDAMTKWAQDMARYAKEPPKMSEEDMRRATQIGQRMGECLQRAMSVRAPEPPPHAQASEPPPFDPPPEAYPSQSAM